MSAKDLDLKLQRLAKVTDEEYFKGLRAEEIDFYVTEKVDVESSEILRCSICFKKPSISIEQTFVRHPLLSVLMCTTCLKNYTKRGWTISDGSSDFCCWCSDGGNLVLCSTEGCINAFCKVCIKKNLGRQAVTEIEDDPHWRCFECEPLAIWNLRALYFAVHQYRQNIQESVCDKIKYVVNEKIHQDVVAKALKFVKTSAKISLESADTLAAVHDDVIKTKKNAIEDEQYVFKRLSKIAEIIGVNRQNEKMLLERIMFTAKKQFPAMDVDRLMAIADNPAVKQEDDVDDSDDESQSNSLNSSRSTPGRTRSPQTEASEESPITKTGVKEEDSNMSTDAVDTETQVDDAKQLHVTLKGDAPSSEFSSSSPIASMEDAVVLDVTSQPSTSTATNSDDLTKCNASTADNSKRQPANASPSKERATKKSPAKASPAKNALTQKSPTKKAPVRSSLPVIESSPSKSALDVDDDVIAVENDSVQHFLANFSFEKTVGEDSDRSSDDETSRKASNQKKSSEATASPPPAPSPPTASSPELSSENDYDKVRRAALATSTSEKSEPDEEKSSEKTAKRKRLKSKSDLDKRRHKVLPVVSDDTDDNDEDVFHPKRLKHLMSETRIKTENSDAVIDIMNETTVMLSNTTSTSHSSKVGELSLPELFAKRPVTVNLVKFSLEVVRELQRYGFINLKEFPELLKHHKPLTRRRNSRDEDIDKEIDRLCNLALLKYPIKKSNSLESSSRRGAKKGMTKELDDSELSSGDDDDVDDSNSEEMLPLAQPDTKFENFDQVRADVLQTTSGEDNNDMSDDDADDDDSKTKVLVKNEKEKNKSSQKSSRLEDPSFMRVRLNDSDDEHIVRKSRDMKSEETSKEKSPSKRKRRIVASSDDDDEDEAEKSEEDDDANSDDDFIMEKSSASSKRKKNGRGADADASSDSESSEMQPKKRRRRIKKMNSSSDENGDGDEDDDQKDGGKKGRHNIRKIIKDKDLSQSTRAADREERDRRKRMEERQKLYNETFVLNKDALLKSLPLDFDPVNKKVLVEVDSRLVTKMKPHQGNGIKFMWDAVFETKKDVDDGKVPGGAILAHCMGLGKTLQTIGLVHTVMKAFPDKIKTVLILCPVNTIKNWVEEFERWLNEEDLMDDVIEVHDVSVSKDLRERADRLKHWQRHGGCMILGYDMYRNLTTKKAKAKLQETFLATLVEPGPDMVVCDEGHILKNPKSALNIAVNKISTRRRIVLTGTPLQNNLSEYYAMVNFVKPQLLGSYGEFKNRFVNPIQNGQHSDSTERDVRVMKKRSFILNDLLKGCMQRLDYNVLTPYLQPKHEYVLCLCLTDLQKKLYTYYLDNYARAGQIGDDGKLEGGRKGGLFYDVQNLSRIWNHPCILEKAKERSDLKKLDADDDEDEDEVGSLKDFIDDDEGSDEAESSNNDEDSDVVEVSPDQSKSKKSMTRADRRKAEQVGQAKDFFGGLDEVRRDAVANSRGWWCNFLPDGGADKDYLLRLEHGAKMVLLMDILRQCEPLGDKVLVFSQSLLSLDLIETFLGLENKGKRDGEPGTWMMGKDYYRMDGSTPPDMRKKWCNHFNAKSNLRTRLFLISTKAGGLGINLVSANRVIIFDASWNPAHDVQSIFRVYRFGQTKPVYIYRFLAKGTMEEKIYDRQVTKQSLSARVVDEQQIERHFSMNELSELYQFNDEPIENRPTPVIPKDRLLAEMLTKHSNLIWKFHDHDSLLENQVDENLTEEERKSAWEEYENEKRGITNILGNPTANVAALNINPKELAQQYRQTYPHLTEEQVIQATHAYIMQLQSAFTRKPAYDKSHYQQEMARAREVQQQLYPGVYRQSQNQAMPSGSRVIASSSASGSLADVERESLKIQLLAQQKRQEEEDQRQLIQRHLITEFQLRRHMEQSVEAVRAAAAAARSAQAAAAAGDDSDDVVILDGSQQLEDYQIPLRSSTTTMSISANSSSRRGRPRLDPDSDTY